MEQLDDFDQNMMDEASINCPDMGVEGGHGNYTQNGYYNQNR
jgi:hypothetical protein